MIVAPAVHSLVADILAPLGRCISLRFLCISHGIGSSKRHYPQSSVFLLFMCIPCPCFQQLWACCPGLLGHCHGCKFTGKQQKSGLLLHEQKTPPLGLHKIEGETTITLRRVPTVTKQKRNFSC